MQDPLFLIVLVLTSVALGMLLTIVIAVWLELRRLKRVSEE